MALFESYERREPQILAALKEYGISSIEECKEITDAAGIDVYNLIEGIQPICFENAKWAYTVGAAIAIKKNCRKAADAAAAIGIGLQAFCIPGSVADRRKVGLGHGNLGKMLLEEDTECFAFLAGHESFAAAEGAIGIAEKANKVRQKPLRVILNGLGKDAAQIISRINGFTYVETKYNYFTGEVEEVFRKCYRQSTTTSQVKLRKYSESATQRILSHQEQRLTATALTMFRKVLLSCGKRMLTYLSQVTQQTLQDSSIQLQVHIRRSVQRLVRSTSQLLQVVVQVVHFTQITWLQVLLRMV